MASGMTDEHKAKLAAGRERARLERQAEAVKQNVAAQPETPPEVPSEPEAQQAAPAEAAPKALKRKRKRRLDGMNLKLQLPERPGFRRRWVNDSPDDDGARVKHFQEDLAYDFIRNEDGSPKKKAVGGGITAYAMETPIEEYEAGQQDKQRALDEMDRTLLRGTTENGPALKDQTGFYGDTKVEREA